jgi:hypothetical protein
MNLIRLNDLHIREKRPFYDALKSFFDWFLKTSGINTKENILWINGDIFHKAHPTPHEYTMFFDFIERCKFKKIYLLTGNHDYALLTGNSLEPFINFQNRVYVIENPEIIKIENLDILALPYIYDFVLDNNTMKNYYENLPEEFSNKKYDYVFYHFEDKTAEFREGHGVNIDYLNADYFDAGHIHVNFNDHYHGVPVISRFDERGHEGTILSIDCLTKDRKIIKVPKFLDYYEVTYPNDFPNLDKDIYPIYNLHDVPTKNIAESYYTEKYKDRELWFRSSYKKKVDSIKNTKKIHNDEKVLTPKEYLYIMQDEKGIEKEVVELAEQYVEMN